MPVRKESRGSVNILGEPSTETVAQVGGRYQATLTEVEDGQATILATDKYGRLILSTGDIQIGAVEIKDHDTDTRVDVIVHDATAPAAPKGMPTMGVYKSSPGAVGDGDAVALLLDEYGRVTLSSDIQIGAVEIKDHDTDTRVDVIVHDTAAPSAPQGMPMMGVYKASPTAVADGDAVALLLDSEGKMQTTGTINITKNVAVNIGSTTTPLGGGATYTGTSFSCDDYSRLRGQVYADQNGTVYVDQSIDGTNWDYTSSWSVTGGTGLAFSVELVGRYVRTRYTNGGVAQTTFRFGWKVQPFH